MTEADYVMSLTQAAATKYAEKLRAKTILIIDEELVPKPPLFEKIIAVPFTKIAKEKVGSELYTNIVALGAVTKVSSLPIEAVKNAIYERFPLKSIEANFAALTLGYRSV